jgi:hypothetical protein
MGAAPSLIWAMGAGGLAPAFILLVPLAVWIYMLIFAFASLWFCHFCLAALQAQRAEAAAVAATPVPAPAPVVPEVIALKDET